MAVVYVGVGFDCGMLLIIIVVMIVSIDTGIVDKYMRTLRLCFWLSFISLRLLNVWGGAGRKVCLRRSVACSFFLLIMKECFSAIGCFIGGGEFCRYSCYIIEE